MSFLSGAKGEKVKAPPAGLYLYLFTLLNMYNLFDEINHLKAVRLTLSIFYSQISLPEVGHLLWIWSWTPFVFIQSVKGTRSSFASTD